MHKTSDKKFSSSSDIANYHMSLSDEQAIEELKKMGINYETSDQL